MVSMWLVVGMLTPSAALAQITESTETTTTTVAPSTTTTGEPIEATTTTIASSTTTTEEPTTTTVSSTTTTNPSPTTTSSTTPATTSTAPSPTTPVSPAPSTTTPAPDPLDEEDPLDDGEEDEEPELLPLPSIVFPVVGGASYSDTFGAPRDGGAREHKGTDISAERGAPVVAVASGVVERMGDAPKAGLYVVLRHSDGWSSAYLHLNNDSPGTDNGLAVGYGPGVEVGARVQAGTVIGYVGDSGNAEDTSPHLHFELHQPDGYRANPYPALRESQSVDEPTFLATVDYDAVQTDGIDVVAHFDPGSGFNAGLAVLDGHAYLGTWGNEERCPGTGVRVLDVSDPTDPNLVAVFADHTTLPGTSASSLWVGDVETDSFRGRLGIVGLQRCSNSVEDNSFVGFAVYDLSDPTEPIALSSVPAGVSSDGLAALDVSVSGEQVLLAALKSKRDYDMATDELAFARLGLQARFQGPSLAIYDISDPNQPISVSSWQPPHPITNYMEPNDAIPGRSERVVWMDHGTIATGIENGRVVVLDVTDPGQPVQVWEKQTMSGDRADTVDLQPGAVVDGRWLILDERVAMPETGLVGRQLIVDSSENTGLPLSGFVPAAIEEDPSESGYYLPSGSARHTAGTGLVAWGSAGVRVIDLDALAEPLEIGHFVPAPAFDPQLWWTAPDGSTRFPMVSDLAVDDGHVHVLDHNSGLWILDITVPGNTNSSRSVAN